MMSVEEYELLRQKRKVPWRIEEMSLEKIERISTNKMDERYAYLDALVE